MYLARHQEVSHQFCLVLPKHKLLPVGVIKPACLLLQEQNAHLWLQSKEVDGRRQKGDQE